MPIFDFISIVFLLFLSAFFSGSETALFSLDKLRLRRLQKQGKNINSISRLLSKPGTLLNTILVGNILVNVAVSSIATSLFIALFKDKGLAVSIFVMTFVLLIFGEVTPKTIAIYKSEAISLAVSRLLRIFSKIIFPLSFILQKITDFLLKVTRLDLKEESVLTEEEFKSIIDYSHRAGIVEEDEREMIRSVLEFTDTATEEIMTPRIDIKAVRYNTEQSEVLEYAKKIKHSKIPVFKDTIDNIVGIIYTKDLFLNLKNDFHELIRPAKFIPSSKKINDLLNELNRENLKIAVVVDEYGGTYGLVTLEDILEEIFGEIYDEFEVKEKLFEKIDKDTLRINGKASIDELNEEFKLKIPRGDYETIAGYILNVFGKIPKENEKIKKGKYEFTIEKLLGRRIKSIILKVK